MKESRGELQFDNSSLAFMVLFDGVSLDGSMLRASLPFPSAASCFFAQTALSRLCCSGEEKREVEAK